MSVTATAQYWVNIVFLALTVWREARGEEYLAKLAVAYSILERVAHPKWWGDDLMSVVFKRLQYSSMTHAGDPNLIDWPQAADSTWSDSMIAAMAATGKGAANPAPGADSYFDDSIAPPSWAKPEMFVLKIGRLNFYNLDRDFEAEATSA
jgi:N-acetylmuramoyl-L-alanine amidase